MSIHCSSGWAESMSRICGTSAFVPAFQRVGRRLRRRQIGHEERVRLGHGWSGTATVENHQVICPGRRLRLVFLLVFQKSGDSICTSAISRADFVSTAIAKGSLPGVTSNTFVRRGGSQHQTGFVVQLQVVLRFDLQPQHARSIDGISKAMPWGSPGATSTSIGIVGPLMIVEIKLGGHLHVLLAEILQPGKGLETVGPGFVPLALKAKMPMFFASGDPIGMNFGSKFPN